MYGKSTFRNIYDNNITLCIGYSTVARAGDPFVGQLHDLHTETSVQFDDGYTFSSSWRFYHKVAIAKTFLVYIEVCLCLPLYMPRCRPWHVVLSWHLALLAAAVVIMALLNDVLFTVLFFGTR